MPCNAKTCSCLPKDYPTCVYWSPSSRSKYYRCGLWAVERRVCPYPGSPCEQCDHYIGPNIYRQTEGDEKLQEKNRSEVQKNYYARNRDRILQQRLRKKHEERLSKELLDQG